MLRHRNKTKKRRRERRIRPVVGRIIVCVLVVAVLTVPTIYINNIFGYLTVLVVLLLILFSFIYLQVIRHGIEFEELSDLSDCERGESVDFIVRLRNRLPLFCPRIEASFFISDLFGEINHLDTAAVSLTPREVYDFQFQIAFAHIGTYTAGLQKLVVHDLLGLFQVTIPGTRECEVEVTPHIYDISAMRTESEEVPESLEMMMSASNDSMDYATVRDYVWGDPLKSIHWKLSARNMKYLTRLYETYSDPGIDVVVDFSAPPGHDSETLMCFFDALVETAFSLRKWADDQGIPCRIVYQSASGEDRTVDSHVDSWTMLEAIKDMPKVDDSGDYDEVASDLLQRQIDSLYTSNIVFVSSRIEEPLMNSLVSAYNLRKHPIFFGVIPEGLDEDERRRVVKPMRALDDCSIRSFVLSSARELEEGGVQ